MAPLLASIPAPVRRDSLRNSKLGLCNKQIALDQEMIRLSNLGLVTDDVQVEISPWIDATQARKSKVA